LPWDSQYHKVKSYRNDLEHLLARDVAVAVQVVHGEGPLELLLELAARRDAERADELAKVDRLVVVHVERAEHVLGELGRVAVRKEVAVDPATDLLVRFNRYWWKNM